jgi:hypothetical protein
MQGQGRRVHGLVLSTLHRSAMAARSVRVSDANVRAGLGAGLYVRVKGRRFRVKRQRFRVKGQRFRVKGQMFRVNDQRLRVKGPGSRVRRLRFWVWDEG